MASSFTCRHQLNTLQFINQTPACTQLLTLQTADVTIMCGCIKEAATGYNTHACHYPVGHSHHVLKVPYQLTVGMFCQTCQKLIVQVQVSCNTMAIYFCGCTVSTYVLFMYSLRLHRLEYIATH